MQVYVRLATAHLPQPQIAAPPYRQRPPQIAVPPQLQRQSQRRNTRKTDSRQGFRRRTASKRTRGATQRRSSRKTLRPNARRRRIWNRLLGVLSLLDVERHNRESPDILDFTEIGHSTLVNCVDL